MVHWDEIIVHHSATHDSDRADTAAYKRFHIEDRGWLDIGYHYVVENIGGEYYSVAGRRLNLAGAHCPGRNHRAIGVCFAGNWENGEPPMEQLEEGSKLIAGLCDILDIPSANIREHREFRDTQCPGDMFPMWRLRTMVDRHRRM